LNKFQISPARDPKLTVWGSGRIMYDNVDDEEHDDDDDDDVDVDVDVEDDELQEDDVDDDEG